MTPPAGRPAKEKTEGFTKQRSFRLTTETLTQMDECQSALGLKSRTEVLEQAVKMLHTSIFGKEKEQ